MRRLPAHWYPRAWAAWAGITVAGFTWLEATAIFGDKPNRTPRDTLTANIQHLTCRNARVKMIAASGWLGFASWAFHHFWISYKGD